jgi:hypothetical protein
MNPIMGDAYTGAGAVEDALWSRWADRVRAHLDRLGWGVAEHEKLATLQRLAWELYCDGREPLVAAKKLRNLRA